MNDKATGMTEAADTINEWAKLVAKAWPFARESALQLQIAAIRLKIAVLEHEEEVQ